MPCQFSKIGSILIISTYRFFATDSGLDLHDLGDVVVSGFELGGLDAFVDADEDVTLDVGAVVDAAQVLDEVVELHAPLGLEVGRVQVRVEHDDGEGEHEDGVGAAQPRDQLLVALAVALSEHLHQTLDLLRLARHPEVRLELAQRHVHRHTVQVHLLSKTSENIQEDKLKFQLKIFF